MDDNSLRQSTGDKNPEQYLDTELVSIVSARIPVAADPDRART